MGNDRGSPDVVIATYREIAEHFGLRSGPDAGRVKAKRARWDTEPGNHPFDTVRVRVPRAVWEAAKGDRTGGNRSASDIPTDPPMTQQLAALLDRLAERDQAELREARELAERRGAELAELRERVGRAEAERDRADQRAKEMEADRDQARVDRDQAELRAREVERELAHWAIGGPIARAVRAFLYRRRL
jgi:hypothetical protein